jgi:hypothetical protein
MENMKAYLDEIGSPMGPIVCATNEEGAPLSLRFRDGRYYTTLEEGLKRVPHLCCQKDAEGPAEIGVARSITG